MTRLAWLTDIHLNFLPPQALEAFLELLAGTEADAFAISGDVGEAHDVCGHLVAIAKAAWPRAVYFVLGNHDFYRGSIRAVRREVELLRPNLHYLSADGLYHLTDDTCMVGHDGWGDGRLGDYHGSHVLLNDFGLIFDFCADAE